MGKLLGFIFGYLILRLPGALLGVWIGHQFDKGVKIQAPKNVEAIRATFFQSTFLMMGHLAKADGRVSEAEIAAARQVMASLQLNAAQKQEAIRLFNEGKQQGFNAEALIRRFATTCQTQPQLVMLFLELQVQTALADGAMNRYCYQVLNQLATSCHLSPQVLDRIIASMQAAHQYRYRAPESASAVDDAYTILGVDKNASPQEIKRAYRKLMSEHHPDKLMAKGLPEEMLKVATERTQTIQKAYESICKSRNI